MGSAYKESEQEEKFIHIFFDTLPFSFCFPRYSNLAVCSASSSGLPPIMPDSAEVGSPKLDTPRSPVSISTDSSRRASFRPPTHIEKGFEPPTPVSPQGRLTRKRAASLNTEAGTNIPPKIGDLALNSASSSGLPSDLTREQVCLCQPDPKIPRPRNGLCPVPFTISYHDWCLGGVA